jgi:hypothetical protein
MINLLPLLLKARIFHDTAANLARTQRKLGAAKHARGRRVACLPAPAALACGLAVIELRMGSNLN